MCKWNILDLSTAQILPGQPLAQQSHFIASEVRQALKEIMERMISFGNLTFPGFIISPNTVFPPSSKALLQPSIIAPNSFLVPSYQNPSLGKNMLSVIYTTL